MGELSLARGVAHCNPHPGPKAPDRFFAMAHALLWAQNEANLPIDCFAAVTHFIYLFDWHNKMEIGTQDANESMSGCRLRQFSDGCFSSESGLPHPSGWGIFLVRPAGRTH
jgi:hypothetical protein